MALTPEFHGIRQGKWGSYEINGWGGYVLKEKLKCLKGDLKVWNKDVFGHIENKISVKSQEIES